MLATESPLFFSRLPQRPRCQERSPHVLPGPCADHWLPSSSVLVSDTSFSTTCFAEVFRSLFQLFPWWEPHCTLGPAQGPLEGIPGAPHTLFEIYLVFLEVIQSLQMALAFKFDLRGLTTLEVFLRSSPQLDKLENSIGR